MNHVIDWVRFLGVPADSEKMETPGEWGQIGADCHASEREI